MLTISLFTLSHNGNGTRTCILHISGASGDATTVPLRKASQGYRLCCGCRGPLRLSAFAGWVCSLAEVLQQPRTVQTQESLCVLLQLLQLVMQPYKSLRVALPLYEQQQILQQLLDAAFACAATPNAKATTTPKSASKQPRQLVRETLLLLAAIVEDRPRFLSAVHRSLIRCKSKE